MNFPSFCLRACGRTAAGPASALHPIVQTVRRQRAAGAAPLLPHGQHCALGARLAVGRSRERRREAETEGKIKGAARLRLPIQSARGVGAARRLAVPVPRRHATRFAAKRVCVPSALPCVVLRWSLRHGLA